MTLSVAAAPAVTVRIIPNTGDGRWTAVYRLPEPAARLDFERNGPYKRLPKWRVETEGYSFVQDGEREAIVKTPNAKPRKSIAISFPVDTSVPVKDCQLFDRFSDGSLALYTGHFNLAETKMAFDLAPRAHAHLVAGGKMSKRRTRWTDADGGGTFVYYGTIKPVETPYMVGVIDPGAPRWLDAKLDGMLPQLFSDYARLTGVALDQRPTVLFAFEAARDRNSTTWKGGTLHALIQLHVEAPADAAEDRDLVERFVKFIAHESAHLWNSQMFHDRESNQSWIHEGGADAFAWRALRRAGIIDDRGLEARQTADLNECLSTLGTRSVDEAEKRGDFKAVYTCGSALAWLTEAALPGDDLHVFWKLLYSAAAARGRSYDEALYLSLLKEQERVPGTAAFIDAFVHEAMPDRAEKLASAFQAAGVPLRPHPEAITREQRRAWGESALLSLMKNDCGFASFDRASGRYRLHGNESCATLKSEVEVDRLEGNVISRAGDAAYDAAAARCAAHEAVTVEGPNGVKLAVPCSKTLPARTPWLAVDRVSGSPQS